MTPEQREALRQWYARGDYYNPPELPEPLFYLVVEDLFHTLLPGCWIFRPNQPTPTLRNPQHRSFYKASDRY